MELARRVATLLNGVKCEGSIFTRNTLIDCVGEPIPSQSEKMVTYDTIHNASISDLKEAIESEAIMRRTAAAFLSCEAASKSEREEAEMVVTLTSLRMDVVSEEVRQREAAALAR